MAKIQEKQLGQNRPTDTTAVSIYSPGDNVTAIITHIFVCNVTANTPSYRIFVDDDGTTYDTTTALYYDNAMAANETEKIPCFIAMNNPDGNIAIRTSAGSEICFTIFGTEIS